MTEQILFTERCEDAIGRGNLQSFKSDLENQLESYTATDIGSSGTKDAESRVLELKLKALILDTIHFIDVVEQLIEANTSNTSEWMWQKQLRFYMSKKGS